jgi:uncharacterized protein (TIGR02611 family)
MRRLNPITLVRKLVVGALGGATVAAGIVMLVTPGPGIVAILGGLAILGTEFAAARRILSKLRRQRDED